MTAMTTPATPALSVGAPAPDFTLKDQNGADVSLSSFRGEKNVVVVFYPFAFSGICTGELCEIRDDLGAFVSDDVQVLAVSCDPMFSLRAFADKEGYFFPLLSDYWPHGEVSRAYGVFNERNGAPIRGTFLVDREGVVRWTLVNGPGDRRDFGGYREAVAALA
jgi:peroxiredoxin (alkyl hydroperoxide reductase subunit C)